MNRILIVCGPTATGKTSLALHLAKVFDGELISADSRQVYKGMDIGTGKDIPDGATWHSADLSSLTYQFSVGFWKTTYGVRIWGYDLTDPTEEFSVAQYSEFAHAAIDEILKSKKLPIIVGGTGLYISAIEGDIETAHIPPNDELREMHKDSTAEELYKLVQQIEPDIATGLNNSDKNNPRRLVRMLEIMQSGEKQKASSRTKYDTLKVGLNMSRSKSEERIQKRVEDRLVVGFEDEIDSLLHSGVSWSDQSMTSLGYRQWREYLRGSMTREEAIEEWIKQEKRYAKRQMTWFKRDENIRWFEVSDGEYRKKVEGLVHTWHNT